MSGNDFVEAGTYSRPGPIGRTVRIILGIALIALFIFDLTAYKLLTRMEFPISTIWIGVVFFFYLFSDIFNIGFDRRWGRWPQYIFITLVAAAILIDIIQYGSFWGPPVGWLIYLMFQFATGFTGVAFILSAILANPG